MSVKKKDFLSDHISDGMKVPAGYFDDFSERMSTLLPDNAMAENPSQAFFKENVSWWTKYRAYIYMAAMFAGVWCMTKMFSLMKDNSADYSLSTPGLTAALSNNDFVDDYVYYSIDEYDILENLYDEGLDLVAFSN